jgi:hypothetical protein
VRKKRRTKRHTSPHNVGQIYSTGRAEHNKETVPSSFPPFPNIYFVYSAETMALHRLAKEAKDILADPPVGVRYFLISHGLYGLAANRGVVRVHWMTQTSCTGELPSLDHKDHRTLPLAFRTANRSIDTKEECSLSTSNFPPHIPSVLQRFDSRRKYIIAILIRAETFV